MRLWEYASRTPGAVGLREIARPWCEAVQRRVRQHTQLGILQGADVLYIERLSIRTPSINATIDRRAHARTRLVGGARDCLRMRA